MKHLKPLAALTLVLATSACLPCKAKAQMAFELAPSQSMLMTGKGPGQDGAINPYAGKDCYAIVDNTGKTAVSVRIQQKGVIIKTIPVSGGTKEKVILLENQELYLDAEAQGPVQITLDFEPMEMPQTPEP